MALTGMPCFCTHLYSVLVSRAQARRCDRLSEQKTLAAAMLTYASVPDPPSSRITTLIATIPTVHSAFE